MRIHRPKLEMPHPMALLALAMIWPLCATLLTAATPPTDQVASKGEVPLQVVAVKADKFWRQVSQVPERIRAHLHNDSAS